MALIDLTGHSFGRLTIIARAENRVGGKHVAWTCRCECGSITTVTTGHLRSGHTTSCGCFASDTTRALSLTHGHTTGRVGGGPVSPEYSVWSAIKQRCFNANTTAYGDYGGRGITMAERWRDDFAAFLADMGPRPPGTTIDRIDNDGNYEPGNCAWRTLAEQANNKRANVRVEYRGRPMTLRQLSRSIAVPYLRLYKLYVVHELPLEECVERARIAGRQVKRHRAAPPASGRGDT